MSHTLADIQAALNAGKTSSRQLVAQALERAQDPAGQGSRVFTRLYAEKAQAAADASDRLRATGVVRSALEGVPVSIKDLFDVAGEPTLAGSVVLKDAPAASHDAVIVQRLVRAGAIVLGKTNMVEFAYSGLGLNPHYGTPASPWDAANQRIPGGSSSGAGVAVAEQMSVVSIGSDTGGSVRIPAAFCGVTGFKPTARRISAQGALPLSTTLDSIGPLAHSVACCAATDAILSGACPDASLAALGAPAPGSSAMPPVAHLRFVVPSNAVLDEADDTVRSVFEHTLQRLRQAGAHIEQQEFPEFTRLTLTGTSAGIIGCEAWAWHRKRLADHTEQYDPRVSSRIVRGQEYSAADYLDLLAERRQWIASVEQRLRGFDALLMPTVPVVAPRIADLDASDDTYFAANRLILRNPTFINFLDGCALSLPCHAPGQAPVGLMVAGPALHDARILAAGRSIEAVIRDGHSHSVA